MLGKENINEKVNITRYLENSTKKLNLKGRKNCAAEEG